MIEALILFRIISDFFWEHKIIGAGSAALFCFASILYFMHVDKKFRLVLADVLALVFFILVALSEFAGGDARSPVEFFKFLAFILIYFAGRVGPVSLRTPRFLGFSCFAGLAAFSAAAALGIGYQYWGAVATFSGGYFFKTDMAISALILLGLISATLTSRVAVFIATGLALYVVFKTNARIAIPLVVAIPIFSILVRDGYIKKLNIKAVAYFSLAAGVGMGLFSLIDFRDLGLLPFDFTNPFSAANTQGRTVIWAAVLEAYSQADPLRKLIGLGLGADVAATNQFSESAHLAGTRAHNSYLYLLIGTGLFGLFSFALFFASLFRRVPVLLRDKDRNSIVIANLFMIFSAIFLWTSLTTEIIIRAQLMALVFYFSGIMVQRSIIIKKMELRVRAESVVGS